MNRQLVRQREKKMELDGGRVKGRMKSRGKEDDDVGESSEASQAHPAEKMLQQHPTRVCTEDFLDFSTHVAQGSQVMKMLHNIIHYFMQNNK